MSRGCHNILFHCHSLGLRNYLNNDWKTRPLWTAADSACVVMIFEKVFTSLIIVGLAAEAWAHVEIEAEDYFFPLEPVINFCKMSDQCQHDFVAICGQDSMGITRNFIDVCDLFEYNCDEKKQFRHVKMDVCQYEAAASAAAHSDQK